MKHIKLYEDFEDFEDFEETWIEEDDIYNNDYKVYISNDEGKCPVCNYDRLTYYDQEYLDDNSRVDYYTCNNCNYKGRVYYEMEFENNLDNNYNHIHEGNDINITSFDRNDIDNIRNLGNNGRYMDNERDICPVCGSDNLEFRDVEYENYNKYDKYMCRDCGFIGIQFFKMKFVSHVDKDIENIIISNKVDEKNYMNNEIS